MEQTTEIKIETSVMGTVIFKIIKEESGKEEIFFAGYDMGNRSYIVKWINEKTFITKTSNARVLCGARGMGMVCDFPTKYHLCRIVEDAPAGWKSWNGKIEVLNEMTCGRKWKEGITKLEEHFNKKQIWVIFVGGGYGSYFFFGTEDEAEMERSRKAMWEKSVARKRSADSEEIKTQVIDKCMNHKGFKSERYACNCPKCQK